MHMMNLHLPSQGARLRKLRREESDWTEDMLHYAAHILNYNPHRLKYNSDMLCDTKIWNSRKSSSASSILVQY